jgi:hypothetical protein
LQLGGGVAVAAVNVSHRGEDAVFRSGESLGDIIAKAVRGTGDQNSLGHGTSSVLDGFRDLMT